MCVLTRAAVGCGRAQQRHPGAVPRVAHLAPHAPRQPRPRGERRVVASHHRVALREDGPHGAHGPPVAAVRHDGVPVLPRTSLAPPCFIMSLPGCASSHRTRRAAYDGMASGPAPLSPGSTPPPPWGAAGTPAASAPRSASLSRLCLDGGTPTSLENFAHRQPTRLVFRAALDSTNH